MASLSRKMLDLTIRGHRLALIAGRCCHTTSMVQRNKPVDQSQCASMTRHTILRSIATFPPNLSQTTQNNDGSAVPEVPAIPVNVVEHAIKKKNTLLLDVRKPEELSSLGQIPTSVNVPVDDLESAMNLSPGDFKSRYGFEKPTPDGKPIIVYCRSGKRAGRAGIILRDKFGFAHVANYVGSWNEWSEKHPEDVKGSAPAS